ncbi:MAG: hypothetical protein P8188_03095 [Gemmatimonadota bacterium]
MSGEFRIIPDGRCERVQRARYSHPEGAGLVEVESRLDCTWSRRSEDVLDVTWGEGSTWGYDDLIAGTDSALVSEVRVRLFIDTEVVCVSPPCPTSWVEEYR